MSKKLQPFPLFKAKLAERGMMAHAREAHRHGGTLVSVPLPSKAKFDAMLEMFKPGCGSMTHVVGTNGGTMPCGAKLTHLDGRTEQYFCCACKERLKGEADMSFKDSPEKARADALLCSFEYKEDKFRSFFTSPYQQYAEHVGKSFSIIKRLPDAENTDGGPGEAMYLIRFPDETEIEALGHEVCILNYKKCK